MIFQLLNYDHQTILLYIGIVVLATFFAKLSQLSHLYKHDYGLISRFNPLSFYLVSFLIVAFFATTTGVGADRSAYAYFYRTSSLERVLSGSEPGFELAMWAFHNIIKNENIFLMLVGFTTVANIYAGFWKLREKISLPWAVFIFTSQYYFQSYNLMRMYFAMSVIILFANLLEERKYMSYLLILLIMSTIHYSILFAVIAYIFAFFVDRFVYDHFEFKVLHLIGLALLFYSFAITIIPNLLYFDNPAIAKYLGYLSEMTESNIGFKWIFDIIPFVLLLFFKEIFYEHRFYLSITVSYMLVSIVISLLSYSVPVIGRALTVLNLPIIVFVPMLFNELKKRCLVFSVDKIEISIFSKQLFISYNIFSFVIIVYFAWSFLMYLSGYLPIDQIDHFHFIWN